jgi:hypothetical protein
LPAKNSEPVHDLLIDMVEKACMVNPEQRATTSMLLRQFGEAKLPEVKPEEISQIVQGMRRI